MEVDSSNEWNNIVGKFTLEKTNSRVIILLEFATKPNLTLANISKPQRESRKYTSHSPTGLIIKLLTF